MTYIAERNPSTGAWTGIALAPADDGTKRQVVAATTRLARPEGYPTKREALAAIRERV
jgi:hypothetical protein